jgi:hypothetical protein
MEMNNEISRGGLGNGWKASVKREDLDFEVTTRPLYVKDKGQLYNLKNDAKRVAVWNDTDKRLLSLVSTEYKPIRHIDVINSLETALDKIGMEPMSDIKYLATPNKNKMWGIVDLKKVDAKVDPVNDTVDGWKLGIVIIHGLDSYAGLSILPNITRTICSNSMWVKKLLGTSRMTHRKDGLVDWFGTEIESVLTDLDNKFKIIPRLHEIPIERVDFMNKVTKTFGKKFTEDISAQLSSPSTTNPLYKVTENSLSLYDAMSVLTFVNQMKAENVGAYLIEQRHVNTERLINSYLPIVG